MQNIIINNLEKLLVDNSFGANQEWYHDKRKRISGCGPTTATNLVKYLDSRITWNSIDDALLSMEVIWNYITPGLLGVNRARTFEVGLQNYFIDNNQAYINHRLEIKSKFLKRISLKECLTFIKEALVNNYPIAFLNRSAAKVNDLSGWHWVLIVGLSYDENNVYVTIYDESQVKKIDFKLWYESSVLGGGLVYFSQPIL